MKQISPSCSHFDFYLNLKSFNFIEVHASYVIIFFSQAQVFSKTQLPISTADFKANNIGKTVFRELLFFTPKNPKTSLADLAALHGCQ
ncbi:hypothetical protein Y032_0018g3627 [Ancylostoma ceylanicum]|nr:hypothetical protein Y032_0018g3627 [Ancylostoma ceylanicum]